MDNSPQIFEDQYIIVQKGVNGLSLVFPATNEWKEKLEALYGEKKWMINYNEQQYLSLLQELVDKADSTSDIRKDRTGVGTISLFGRTMEFDLSDMKVPLLTTKKVPYQRVLEELFWMFRLGNPDTSYLDDNNNNIWKSWTVYNNTYPQGTIGKMYGQILRDPECDQLRYVIDLLKKNPTSRRAVISVFDPRVVADESKTFEENVMNGKGVLNPCHLNFGQFYINDDNELESMFIQRSADIPVGLPFNLMFYGVFSHLIARSLGIQAKRMVYVVADTHIYSNQVEGAKEQLPRPPYECPTIIIDENIKDFDDWNDVSQVTINNYQHHPFIKFPVAV